MFILVLQTWDNFDKCASWHASNPLQLFHNDLCGLIPSDSFFGFKEFLRFIDEHSRCICVYFLKVRSEFLDMFLAYKDLVEQQSG